MIRFKKLIGEKGGTQNVTIQVTENPNIQVSKTVMHER